MVIDFKKETFPIIDVGKGRLAFDCHVHSRHSDGFSSIEKILQQARTRNCGIAITDHNEIAGVMEGYENTMGVPVIPGIEVSCRDRIHLLLYFYDPRDLSDFFNEHIKPNRRVNHNTFLRNMSAFKIAKIAKQYNCIVALAHPYGQGHRTIDNYMKISGNEKFLNYIDCIEVLNGTLGEKSNRKALDLAEKLHKSVIGGSDGHVVSVIGRTITIAPAANYREFLDRVKEKNVELVGKRANIYQQGKMIGVLSYRHISAATKKHHTNIAASLALMALLQKFSIPLLYFLGATAYKKVKERRTVKK